MFAMALQGAVVRDGSSRADRYVADVPGRAVDPDVLGHSEDPSHAMRMGSAVVRSAEELHSDDASTRPTGIPNGLPATGDGFGRARTGRNSTKQHPDRGERTS